MAVVDFFKNNSQIISFVVTVLLVIVIVWGVHFFMNKKEGLENVSMEEDDMPLIDETEEVKEISEKPMVTPIPTSSSTVGAPVPEYEETTGDISPEDLLPKSSDASAFEEQFPVGAGDLSSKNFLTAGYNIGINTVSSSLRNANLQLRSDVPIPVRESGPWNQSTIVPDLNRKSLEIGS